jgi:hypothetical protein
MKAEDIKIGMKLELMSNGKPLVFEVKDIENGTYKIFNKFRVSWYAPLEYINQNLISIK